MVGGRTEMNKTPVSGRSFKILIMSLIMNTGINNNLEQVSLPIVPCVFEKFFCSNEKSIFKLFREFKNILVIMVVPWTGGGSCPMTKIFFVFSSNPNRLNIMLIPNRAFKISFLKWPLMEKNVDK